jgi:hypothetical protein
MRRRRRRLRLHHHRRMPVGGWSKIKNQLDAAAGTSAPWRLHDLRRTFVTGLAISASGPM